jgi:hypothetical protein
MVINTTALDAGRHVYVIILFSCSVNFWTQQIICVNVHMTVFKIRVLRDEVTGEWRKLHNEELNDLHPSPTIVWVMKSSKMRWAGHVVRMGEERGVYRVWVGKPEGKRPLGRPRHRWEGNIKMDLQEMGCGGMDWIDLAQDRDRW